MNVRQPFHRLILLLVLVASFYVSTMYDICLDNRLSHGCYYGISDAYDSEP